MNTFSTVFAQLTEPQYVFPRILEALRQIDPTFEEEHKNYTMAVKALTEYINDNTEVTLTEFLAAKESELCYECLYVAWLGFQQNLKCFKDPIAAQFLDLDYEEIHREDSFGKLPDVAQAHRTIDMFYAEINRIADGEDDPTEGIIEFYSYMETTAFKLAHFWGFTIANLFLEKVVPGYCQNHTITSRYKLMLESYLGFELSKNQ